MTGVRGRPGAADCPRDEETRGGAVVAPRDVFWSAELDRCFGRASSRKTGPHFFGSTPAPPPQDFGFDRRSYLYAVPRDFTDLCLHAFGVTPPATSRRPRCRDVPNAREGSRVCAVAFVRSSHTVCFSRFRHALWARLRHDLLHALLRASARHSPTCSPLPHQRRLAIMLEACLRHDTRVREDATRLGREAGISEVRKKRQLRGQKRQLPTRPASF